MYSISDTPRRVLPQHKLRVKGFRMVTRQASKNVNYWSQKSPEEIEPSHYTSVDVAGECCGE